MKFAKSRPRDGAKTLGIRSELSVDPLFGGKRQSPRCTPGPFGKASPWLAALGLDSGATPRFMINDESEAEEMNRL